MSTHHVVELVGTWVVEQPDGHLRLMVRGIVNGREYATVLMSSEHQPGVARRSRIDVIEAHRQIRRKIARISR